jgi:hypothetical protein
VSAGRADEAYSLNAAQAEANSRQPVLQDMKRRTEEWVKAHTKTR